jgi:hypothetical protein
MFSTVKTAPNLTAGSAVSFDTNAGVFNLAGSLSTPLGVLQLDAALQEDGSWVAPVAFAGIAYALASRDIPDEGGELMVENGKVYVDNEANGAGIICPLPYDQSSRTAGSLVMVHIR